MKADEIRSWPVGYPCSTDEMLRELTAQLAEANEHLNRIANPLMTVVNEEAPWVWLTDRNNPFVIDRSEVSGVSSFDGSAGQVMIGMKGEAWCKTADGTVAEVCAKLGIPTDDERPVLDTRHHNGM